MSEHRARVEWKRTGEFRDQTYSRAHGLRFDAISVPGNAAPGNIPATVKPGPGIDPEQAFVASLSACHMLWFLHLACQKKPLHHRAHEKCFIANSVKTEVIVEPCLK